MTKAYRLNHSCCLYSQDRIEEFEVDLETTHFVRVKGDKCKQARVGDYHSWHTTRAQAAEKWLERCRGREENAARLHREASRETAKAEKLCAEVSK